MHEEAPAPHLAAGFVTFASFNVLPKVTDAAIAAWCAILKAVPGSRFLINCKQLRDERVRERIRGDFVRHGIDPARVEMAAFVASVREHLDYYAKVDLALDTFPYNGTTTTCESLYMGVPVLTIAGDNHRGRVGVSLLTAVGLQDDFVAAMWTTISPAPSPSAARPHRSPPCAPHASAHDRALALARRSRLHPHSRGHLPRPLAALVRGPPNLHVQIAAATAPRGFHPGRIGKNAVTADRG